MLEPAIGKIETCVCNEHRLKSIAGKIVQSFKKNDGNNISQLTWNVAHFFTKDECQNRGGDIPDPSFHLWTLNFLSFTLPQPTCISMTQQYEDQKKLYFFAQQIRKMLAGPSPGIFQEKISSHVVGFVIQSF